METEKNAVDVSSLGKLVSGALPYSAKVMVGKVPQWPRCLQASPILASISRQELLMLNVLKIKGILIVYSL